jgi:hypothetical protein
LLEQLSFGTFDKLADGRSIIGLEPKLGLQRSKFFLVAVAHAQSITSPALMLVEGFTAPVHRAQRSAPRLGASAVLGCKIGQLQQQLLVLLLGGLAGP